MSKYGTIITTAGREALAQALANGTKVRIAEIAVGDGGGKYYVPDPEQTALKGEKWRGSVANGVWKGEYCIVAVRIPADVGGFTIREMAAISSKGIVMAIAVVADMVKPDPSEGMAAELRPAMTLAVSQSESVEIVLDSNIVTATVFDLERHNESLDAHKNLITFATPEEAQAGTSTTKIMNPKRVKELVDRQLESSEEHLRGIVNHKNGSHGLRYYQGVLSYFDGTDWVEIKTDSSGLKPGGALTPACVTDLKVTPSYGKLAISWKDPPDKLVNGEPIMTWAGTKLVRCLENRYPTNDEDGVVLVDSTTRDAYAERGFEDTGLTDGQEYYYKLFPYSTAKVFNSEDLNQCKGVSGPEVFGVRIDTANPDSRAAVTYTDGAVGMQPRSSAWDRTSIFRGIRPCLFKEGKVVCYLDPDDFSKTVDGEDADITSGDAGDVMIEFPKLGYSITRGENYIDVKVTSNPNDPNFCYYAHTRQEEGDRDFVYIGAYLWLMRSSNDPAYSRIMYSRKGYFTYTGEGTCQYKDFVNAAHATGSGYELFSFYQLVLIQCLYLLRYKNLHSQYELGIGRSQDVNGITGATYQSGMHHLSTNDRDPVKFLGLEDLYGFGGCIIDRIRTSRISSTPVTYEIDMPDLKFGINGNYISKKTVESSPDSAWMSLPFSTNELAFLPEERNGTDSTYWGSDFRYCNTGTGQLKQFLALGGNIFSLYGKYQTISTDYFSLGSKIYARVMYL